MILSAHSLLKCLLSLPSGIVLFTSLVVKLCWFQKKILIGNIGNNIWSELRLHGIYIYHILWLAHQWKYAIWLDAKNALKNTYKHSVKIVSTWKLHTKHWIASDRIEVSLILNALKVLLTLKQSYIPIYLWCGVFYASQQIQIKQANQWTPYAPYTDLWQCHASYNV